VVHLFRHTNPVTNLFNSSEVFLELVGILSKLRHVIVVKPLHSELNLAFHRGQLEHVWVLIKQFQQIFLDVESEDLNWFFSGLN